MAKIKKLDDFLHRMEILTICIEIMQNEKKLNASAKENLKNMIQEKRFHTYQNSNYPWPDEDKLKNLLMNYDSVDDLPF